MKFAGVCVCWILFALSVSADDLDKLSGKWSVNKTNDQGQAYAQTIEVKKDKFTFKISGKDGSVYLYAEGHIKVEKLGPFQVIKLTDIKAGQSETDTQSIDDDRTSIYQLDRDTWTLASNFDKERNQKPVVDVYKKVQ
jgi:uncharacterized protein (TIGR03067 family)